MVECPFCPARFGDNFTALVQHLDRAHRKLNSLTFQHGRIFCPWCKKQLLVAPAIGLTGSFAETIGAHLKATGAYDMHIIAGEMGVS